MHRHGDDTPNRARPGHLARAIERVELDDFSARRYHLAQTFGENLFVAIVSDDAQGDHRQAQAKALPSYPTVTDGTSGLLKLAVRRNV